MEQYYLAIDLGASGGRHILGHVEEGKLRLEEAYRFSNAPLCRDNSLVWDEERLLGEIIAGLEQCRRLGKIPCSLGIDTWGVDYALLDGRGELIKPVYAYRDSRTRPFLEAAPFEELYAVTGIARQPFNTVYQLLADRAAGRLDRAAYLLQLPEYFTQRLAGNLLGKEFSEYTMASTTGLVDARKKDWAGEVLEKLDLPRRIFKPLREPPYPAGELSGELRKRLGFNARLVMVASHDTASAVASVSDDTLYISSGTWSLLGLTGDPVLNEAAREAGYTNEGAHNGRIRFLKNIMGLWVLQSLRRELGDRFSFAGLERMARETGRNAPPDWTIDLNQPCFLAPPGIIAEIKNAYRKSGMGIPESPGELAFCVYASLAQCYRTAAGDLETITGKTYPAISIIGGGSKDAYLNALTAAYTGKTVYAGPAEASAIGNILLQMRQAGDPALGEGFAALVRKSFGITIIQGDNHV